jgi:hypothetical protein
LEPVLYNKIELKPILAVNMICELRPDGVMKPMIHVMAQRFNPAFLLKQVGGRCISTKIHHTVAD